MPCLEQGAYGASRPPGHETTAYTTGAVRLLAQAVTLPLTQSEGVGNGDVTRDEMLTHSTNCKRSQTKMDMGALQRESY